MIWYINVAINVHVKVVIIPGLWSLGKRSPVVAECISLRMNVTHTTIQRQDVSSEPQSSNVDAGTLSSMFSYRVRPSKNQDVSSGPLSSNMNNGTL